MPELPEVETIRRQLNDALRGKKITHIEILRDKSFQGNPHDLKGAVIKNIGRKAKVIELYFEKSKLMVICHLKMTGQLIFLDGKKRILGGHPSPDWVNDLPSKHTRVVWTFEGGAKLFFNDMRVFGWMKVVDKEKYEKDTRNLIPDVIDDNFTKDYLFSLLKKSNKAIKLVLLDQDKIGGMGNIYVNDALFLAGVRPDRKADSITK